MNQNDELKIIEIISKPFVENRQDHFIVKCCGKIYAGLHKINLCQTCKKQPENTEVIYERIP